MELTSSLTGQSLDRPTQTDMSTLGAAFMAGLACGNDSQGCPVHQYNFTHNPLIRSDEGLALETSSSLSLSRRSITLTNTLHSWYANLSNYTHRIWGADAFFIF